MQVLVSVVVEMGGRSSSANGMIKTWQGEGEEEEWREYYKNYEKEECV